MGALTSRSILRTRIRSTGGGEGVLCLSRSIILSLIRTGGGGDGERSRILSRVSTTRARSLSCGGRDGDLSLLSTILVEVRIFLSGGGGVGERSIILSRSRILTGEGDLGRRSRVLISVVSLSLRTNGPVSTLP